MKNILIITGTALAFASAAQAQALIAGFDFGNAAANYSDLGLGGAANDGNNANIYGSFSFQDGPGNPFDQTQFFSGDLTAGSTLFSPLRIPGFNDSFDTDGTGGLIAEDIGFASADGGFFDFTVTPGGLYQDYRFGFAAGVTQPGTSDLNLSYSTDGGSNFTSLSDVSVSTQTSAGGQAYDIDASGFSASSVVFRVTFTDIDTGVLFDNIQVQGTVVPEPSSFAAIAGAIAVAFVASRRRIANA